jgi:pimeloyl-[acyl-carrier protein] methyl ester esterase
MEKETLLMLPGWGMDNEVFSGLRSHLNGRFDVVDVTWSDITDHSLVLEKLIEISSERISGKFSVLGWSMGALAALELANACRDMIKSLVLISPTSSFCSRSDDGYEFGWKPVFVERLKKRVAADRTKALCAFYDSMFSDSEESHRESFRKIAHGFAGRYSTESLIAGLEYLRESDQRRILSQVEVPTLILQGSSDAICPLEGAVHIYENIRSDKTIHVLENAGHVPFITDEYACIGKIDEFLEKHR